MNAVRVVVADGTLARLFSLDELTESLEEVEAISHPEGRMHERDLTSDLPGKVVSGTGGRHGLEGERSPKKQELSQFARTIADHLDKLRNSGKVSRILLVAAPSLLGELRRHMSPATAKLVVFELDKDLVHRSAQEIQDHLPAKLLR